MVGLNGATERTEVVRHECGWTRATIIQVAHENGRLGTESCEGVGVHRRTKNAGISGFDGTTAVSDGTTRPRVSNRNGDGTSKQRKQEDEPGHHASLT